MLDPLSILIPASHVRPSRPTLPRRFLLQPSPDHPDDYLLHLDYSHGLSAYLECPRKWQNLNIHAREANRPTVAKDFGSAFHACEEMRLRDGFSESLLGRQREFVQSFFLSHPVPADEYRNCDRLLEVLGQYNKLHGDDGWPEAVVLHRGEKAVELAFKLEFATVAVNNDIPFYPNQLLAGDDIRENGRTSIRNLHIVFTGKIDAVLQQNNVLFVVDHKTSSRGGKEFEDAFRLSLQTRGYCWAAQKILGREVAGLVMNAVVVRPKTVKGTGVPTQFNRHTYFYPPWSLDEWEQNVHATVEDIVASLQRGYFPQTSRSFKSPCAGCDFHENCALPPKDRAFDLASSLYSDVTWSPTNEAE